MNNRTTFAKSPKLPILNLLLRRAVKTVLDCNGLCPAGRCSIVLCWRCVLGQQIQWRQLRRPHQRQSSVGGTKMAAKFSAKCARKISLATHNSTTPPPVDTGSHVTRQRRQHKQRHGAGIVSTERKRLQAKLAQISVRIYQR